ncbi:SRPBCC domain-containing protein [Saccharothrix sp.]|uniref:SRPBCC domain-containing protein n=1 Tax=Saccharothrix sp. TaxID=1873460 RepID=UPI002811F3A1|nr:SRPBCC domain-containing protein [Saccharothrix sp.]
MQENELRTEVVIDAPAAVVWAVLTDFSRYREWNDLIEYVSGEAEEGAEVRTRAAWGSPAEREFEGRITTVEPPGLLASEGGDPELFFGRHRWELSDEGARTRLVNREVWSGALADAVYAESKDVLTAEFDAFNRALKAEAERRA